MAPPGGTGELRPPRPPPPDEAPPEGTHSDGATDPARRAVGVMRWQTYTEPDEVVAALRSVMQGATPDGARRWAKRQGLEVSELVDNVVYASAPAPSSHPLILAKWLLQFHFDGGRLRDVRVRRGLTGP